VLLLIVNTETIYLFLCYYWLSIQSQFTFSCVIIDCQYKGSLPFLVSLLIVNTKAVYLF